MVPATLLAVHARFDVAAGVVGARAARADHLEPGVEQRVERLLEERVFEKEPRRVSTAVTPVDVSALVQRFLEHFAAQRHAPRHEDAPQLAKLDVGDASVATEGEGAAVTDDDEPSLAASRQAGQVSSRQVSCRPVSSRRTRPVSSRPVSSCRTGSVSFGQAGLVYLVGSLQLFNVIRRPATQLVNRSGQTGQAEELSFAFQTTQLAKRLRQNELTAAQVVEHVTEQNSVSVNEVPAPQTVPS